MQIIIPTLIPVLLVNDKLRLLLLWGRGFLGREHLVAQLLPFLQVSGIGDDKGYRRYVKPRLRPMQWYTIHTSPER